MSFYTVLSASVQGLDVEVVKVEADVSNGLPVFHMVGYLSSEVKEASDRVRTAMRNIGYPLPAKKVIVNLSPACVRKRGTVFDLPIAVSVLGALQVIPEVCFKNTLLIGELGLDGTIQSVDGALPIVSQAKRQGITTCILPIENLKEGELVQGIRLFGAETLEDVCKWARGENGMVCGKNQKLTVTHDLKEANIDYSDILGQEGVKRATLVAVAGNHNLLYIGPPGSGKTMMAKRIPTILPEMSLEDSLEVTRIYSAVGQIRSDNPLITIRPFREVHHTVTKAALAGGGRIPMPGEVTMAHGGVLFLDELAEFPRGVLEVLRQPLEEKCIHLVRQYGAYCFPADFMLVAATNPCPCGYYPDLEKCHCTTLQIQKYLGKISQAFLDRMDICVEAGKVEYEALKKKEGKNSSERMRKQVEMARERQAFRFRESRISTNAQMGKEELSICCALENRTEKMLSQAYEIFNLTARSYHKILKVSRTIADLDDCEKIKEEHVKEAIGYRMIDKKYWGC